MINQKLLSEVINMPGVGRKQIAKLFKVSEQTARMLCIIRDSKEDISEVLTNEFVESNQKYKAEKQKFQDTNRLERKTWRENIRLYNALNEQNQELLNGL